MKGLWTIGLCLLMSCVLIAQNTPLQNGGLENWATDPSGDFEEPTGYWTTANKTFALGAEVSTIRETEKVVEGQFAAKLITRFLFTFPVAGTVAIGVFDNTALTPDQALKFGTPFTNRPSRFQGHYMYFPEETDSADIYTLVTKWNSGTNQRDTIGSAWLRVYDVVEEYTYFDIPLTYTSNATPDTLIVVASSSAGGREFRAVEGSTLYIDGFNLSYTAVGIHIPLMAEVETQVYPNPARHHLQVALARSLQNGTLVVYNALGQQVTNTALNNIQNQVNISHLADGIYFYQVYEDQQLISGGQFEVIHD